MNWKWKNWKWNCILWEKKKKCNLFFRNFAEKLIKLETAFDMKLICYLKEELLTPGPKERLFQDAVPRTYRETVPGWDCWRTLQWYSWEDGGTFQEHWESQTWGENDEELFNGKLLFKTNPVLSIVLQDIPWTFRFSHKHICQAIILPHHRKGSWADSQFSYFGKTQL